MKGAGHVGWTMVPKPFLHLFFFYFVTVEIEVRALYMPSECPTTELPLQLTSIYYKGPEENALGLAACCVLMTKAALVKLKQPQTAQKSVGY